MSLIIQTSTAQAFPALSKPQQTQNLLCLLRSLGKGATVSLAFLSGQPLKIPCTDLQGNSDV